MKKLNFDDIVRIPQNGVLFYCVKSETTNEWGPILACQPCYNRSIEIDGELYMDDRYITINSDNSICSIMPKDRLNFTIKEAISFITSRGKLVDINKNDYYLNQYINELEQISLVKDTLCFPYDGEIPLDDEIMQKLCLEKPVRNVCIDLSRNGIKTLMSSANAKNITSRDVCIDEQRIYIGEDDPWTIGNGYAWIMMDWDALSDENKQYLISIRSNETDLELSDSDIKKIKI